MFISSLCLPPFLLSPPALGIGCPHSPPHLSRTFSLALSCCCLRKDHTCSCPMRNLINWGIGLAWATCIGKLKSHCRIPGSSHRVGERRRLFLLPLLVEPLSAPWSLSHTLLVPSLWVSVSPHASSLKTETTGLPVLRMWHDLESLNSPTARCPRFLRILEYFPEEKTDSE